MKHIITLMCIFAPIICYAQQHQQQQNYQQPQVNYRPLSQAPAGIKQLLQFQQAREPLVNIPAQTPPKLAPAQPIQPVQTPQGHLSQYQPKIQYGQAPQQPNYQNQAAAFAAQYRPQQQQGPAPQQQYQG
ncbi:hypothetical protein PV327_007693 [Microctonus hyperodae]|uniref:Uncharacterized protein n=1 Tax=Microctonus hyperodae TaxID=165561 RepID=A0AA39FZQ6_MICHY|nr:hypothetical protein PV327_007693 [Microctonus hyperodae]